MRALARRAPSAPPVVRHGDLVVDLARRQASRAGRPISLTRKEFAVLEVLLSVDGAVVSAEELLERAWDEHADPFSRTVTVTLARLAPSWVSPRSSRPWWARGTASGDRFREWPRRLPGGAAPAAARADAAHAPVCRHLPRRGHRPARPHLRAGIAQPRVRLVQRAPAPAPERPHQGVQATQAHCRDGQRSEPDKRCLQEGLRGGSNPGNERSAQSHHADARAVVRARPGRADHGVGRPRVGHGRPRTAAGAQHHGGGAASITRAPW